MFLLYYTGIYISDGTIFLRDYLFSGALPVNKFNIIQCRIEFCIDQGRPDSPAILWLKIKQFVWAVPSIILMMALCSWENISSQKHYRWINLTSFNAEFNSASETVEIFARTYLVSASGEYYSSGILYLVTFWSVFRHFHPYQVCPGKFECWFWFSIQFCIWNRWENCPDILGKDIGWVLLFVNISLSHCLITFSPFPSIPSMSGQIWMLILIQHSILHLKPLRELPGHTW
jgi:hypothetical protein